MKSIQSLILTLGSLFIIACHSTKQKGPEVVVHKEKMEKTCMDKVIAADSSLGGIRNHACKTISLSKTIQQYVAAAEKLEYQNCPESFTTAFKNHQIAWMKMLEVTDEYPDLRGELHELFDQLEISEDKEAFKIFLKSIWDTWAEVEKAMKS